jgi:murein DD-endopeptidase MepM/ murein hydrolase activator NlpD
MSNIRKNIRQVLKEYIKQKSNLKMTESYQFPIGNDNFNIGYDSLTLGDGKRKVLDKDIALHNSDYGGGDVAHRARGGHKGIDIFAPKGTPLVSCVTGKVVKIRKNSSVGGNTITIRDNNGLNYYYAHMDRINPSIKKGDLISSGQLIGTVGDSGNAKGTYPHLHFSIYDDRGYNRGNIDPWPFLKHTMGSISKLSIIEPGELKSMDIENTLKNIDVYNLPSGIKIGDIIKNNDNSELIVRGSKGEGVEEFQKILVDLGYDLGDFGPNKDGVDGKFGPETQRAVKEFQKDNGLKIDGIIGIETAFALSQFM